MRFCNLDTSVDNEIQLCTKYLNTQNKRQLWGTPTTYVTCLVNGGKGPEADLVNMGGEQTFGVDANV